MALQAQETDLATVEAVATKVIDRWVVDVLGRDPVSVRVHSLDDVDAAVNRARRLPPHTSRAPVRVHIHWYR